MKYFVAHLLTGDVYQYHRSLTEELSSRFHIAPLHERVDPHITIKNFEANEYEIARVEGVLTELTSNREPPSLYVEGFGRFGHKTVYLDILKSRRATLFARECIAALNELRFMQPSLREGEKLHASVARYLSYRQFRKVWRHIRNESPRFETTLNALAILKKESGKRWETHRLFPLSLNRTPYIPTVSAYTSEYV